MKKDVAPHKNLFGINQVPREYSQFSESARKRKREHTEMPGKKQKPHRRQLNFDTKSLPVQETVKVYSPSGKFITEDIALAIIVRQR